MTSIRLIKLNDNGTSAEELASNASVIDAFRVRQGIPPSLLSEVEAVLSPVSIVLGAFIAKILYFDVALHSLEPASRYLGAGMMAAVVMTLIASHLDLHSTSSIIAGRLKMRSIVTTTALTFLVLVGFFYLLKISDYYSRVWIVLWFLCSIAALLAVRVGIVWWARLLLAENRLMQRVAIYGSVDLAERVLTKLQDADRHLMFAGAYSDDGGALAHSNMRVRGNIHALIAAVQSGACDRVIVALPRSANDKIRDAIALLELLPIEVQYSPDAMTVPWPVQGAEQAGRLVLLDLQRRPLSARGMLVKTTLDYVFGAVALVLFAPLMLLIAAAIKLDSKGPVFFVQLRHGYNHRLIRIFKFRSMSVVKDEDGAVVTQAVRGDKRITCVGRFLRRTSLDELPQLFNVLRGELSIVGPRPHAVSHNDAYAKILDGYVVRHKVKPGITGWAQVNGLRGETADTDAMRKRLELDLYYIKNWSLWLDLEILARTTLVPFSGVNAY